MKSLYSIIAMFAFLPLFMACSKDDTPAPDPLLGLTKEGTVAGARVEIWSKTALFAGYNELTVAVYDSANPAKRIEESHIQFMPVMTMNMNGMTYQHSAPIENPAENAVKGVFPGAIIFQMASMGGSWKLKLHLHNHLNNREGELEWPITVAQPEQAMVKTLVATDNSKLIIAWRQKSTCKVGINDFELACYKMQDMMSFPAVTDFTCAITPEMPSMNHGSPNNVDPLHNGNGHYLGKVNFTMTGDWRIHIQLKKNGTDIAAPFYFDTLVK
jgi:YtkA-like